MSALVVTAPEGGKRTSASPEETMTRVPPVGELDWPGSEREQPTATRAASRRRVRREA
jgi:hypothetical protein